MAVDTIAGTVGTVLHYHYDVTGDVLYLRLQDALGLETYGEEDEHGFHLLHALTDDRLVGMTVIGFWRQFGEESEPLTSTTGWEQKLEDSVSEFGRQLLAA